MKKRLLLLSFLLVFLISAGSAGPIQCVRDPNFAAKHADKHDGNAIFFFRNYSGQQVRVIITSPIYADYTFVKSCAVILNYGTYKYIAWVGKDLYSGTFTVSNGDKHALKFYPHKVHFHTP